MKPLKSTLTAVFVLLTTAVSATAFAHHREWHHGGPPHSRPHYVVPRSDDDFRFGFSIGAPVWYEPAPRYYYAPAPQAYYYEPAPSYYYYYDDGSPTFPSSNADD